MRSARVLLYLLVALVAIDAVLSWYAAAESAFPATAPMGSPTAYRNLYLHIPMAWASLILFTVATAAAIGYLVTGRESLDRIVRGFAAIGLVYAAATLVTGSAWASESWGAAWNWDPRETSVLLLFLAYLVYFVIRGSIPDPDRAKTLSNVYAVAAYAMVPLVFMAPAFAKASLHPSFETARQFLREPQVLPLFVGKVLVVVAIGVVLGILASSKKLPEKEAKVARVALALFALYSISAALLLSAPYFTSQLGRVIDANVTPDGMITSLRVRPLGAGGAETLNITNAGASASDLVFNFNPPIDSPIKPAVTTIEGVKRPTIVLHIIDLKKLEEENRIVIVNHWSVMLSVALNGVMVLAGYEIALRLARRNEAPE
ncbi:cytochrome c assembly protein [Pyrolobus fumarii 1A]|uniref:Cytochrome c assembly protein n=1 Tax=Pyrolobus fumarii (strain DSM 11204 / 1A) TaxID=694429 RepID=G0ECY2_PYRF1|nr:cytochrome c biogenesis protein CcsA [Pyrolobus fumarii]AEM39702.1 cytochrome c assembly protein [Pyrolobus fumarii 1A]